MQPVCFAWDIPNQHLLPRERREERRGRGKRNGGKGNGEVERKREKEREGEKEEKVLAEPGVTSAVSFLSSNLLF